MIICGEVLPSVLSTRFFEMALMILVKYLFKILDKTVKEYNSARVLVGC